MIIKGHSRGRAMQLVKHLLDVRENERVHIHECRGTVSLSVEGALTEMEAQGAGGRSRKALYHASISPQADRPLDSKQLAAAANLLEEKLGLGGQPRLIVVHRKQGREHAHVVWSRVDRAGKLISDGWNYARHEETARELEQLFDHDRVQGAFTGVGAGPRPARTPAEYELRQVKRSGITTQSIREELTAAWASSDSAEAFKVLIEANGYWLARGDRRGFVVVDRAGKVHSLARSLGLKTAELSAKLDRSSLAALPDVREARNAMKPARVHGIHRLMIRTYNIRTGPSLIGLSVLSSQNQAYAAQRASIVSGFAAKFADVCASGQGRQEIEARLRRLRDEQSATLDRLRKQSQDGKPAIYSAYRSAAKEVGFRRTVKRLAYQPSSRIKPS